MRLWTIQHKEAYTTLQEKGVLHANEEHLFCEDDFRYAYDWMANKLSEKDTKPNGVNYPLWAWYQWEGKRKRRDLRNTGLGERGTSCVQLEIEIPDNKVLLSDFDVFHIVLNNCNLCGTEEEDRQFESWYKSLGIKYGDWRKDVTGNPSLQEVKDRIIKSWDGIFDLEKEDDNWIYGKNENKSIQAVFWELRIEQVSWACEFKAR